MNDEYEEFLASKLVSHRQDGVDVPMSSMPDILMPFQAEIIQWALRQGKAALFEPCGFGKTFQQIEFAYQAARFTDKPSLILAPLAVAGQTAREGTKLGRQVTVCRTQDHVKPGVNVTNYDMIDHFDVTKFGAVVLDESAILRNFSGTVKQKLCYLFQRTPFRLCCTATPAPNDYKELGNHSEFLGAMRSNEMLMRWFINDTMKMNGYVLKGHAEADYWRWVSTWSTCLSLPSDLGYSDDGFVLPELSIKEVIVETDWSLNAPEGELMRSPSMSATTMHAEMRLTAVDRARAAADIVSSDSQASWPVWCNTDYEADELMKAIPYAVDLRGSESVEAKEKKLLGFVDGSIRVLITKPRLAAYGLNWQHAHKTVFVGLSHSFDAFYQALRRLWRFGQTHPVEAYIIMAETEGAVLQTIRRKQDQHERMVTAMVNAMKQNRMADNGRLNLSKYTPTIPMILPSWLKADATVTRVS